MTSSLTVFAIFAGLFVVSLAQQGAAPPPFLEGQSPDVINSFQAVLEKGRSLTDSQLDKEVEAWIATQSAGVKTKYIQFKTELKNHQSNAEKAHQAAVSKFSPEAKAADAKLAEIASHPGLSAQQKNEQIETIVKGLPENVRNCFHGTMERFIRVVGMACIRTSHSSVLVVTKNKVPLTFFYPRCFGFIFLVVTVFTQYYACS